MSATTRRPTKATGAIRPPTTAKLGAPVRAAVQAAALLPTGTARARLAGAGGSEADQALPRALWEQLAARDVAPESLLAAWEVARWTSPQTPAAERRALACLVIALGETTRAGSAFLALGPALAPELARLGFGETDQASAAALGAAIAGGSAPPAVAALVGPPGARRPFVVEGEALYPERLWSFEDRLITNLRARLSRSLPSPSPSPSRAATPAAAAAPLETAGSVEGALAAVASGPGAPTLSAEQVAAVRRALGSPLTLVTGGPGSGKTSIVVALMRALVRRGVAPERIAVAAPTGRAAQRIEQSVHEALARLTDPQDLALRARFAGASTIHRLLGIRGARLKGLEADAPEYHAGWRLPHQVVVIDEASMIDLFLMTELTAALADDARLVLLGDADQLPSVELGAVFRELTGARPDLTCRLTSSHRMNPADPGGAEILAVAGALNTGAPLGAAIAERPRAGQLRWSGVEQLPRARLPELLERWYAERLGGEALSEAALDRRFTAAGDGRLSDDDARDDALVRLLAAHAGARILCVTRAADRLAGADAINALLHARAVGVAEARAMGGGDAAAPFLPGEPVTVLRNDYARGLWNGDQGVVVRAGGPTGDRLGVVFARPAGHFVHPLDHLRDNLGLAFAVTVHKAQGSEYDQVALILPEVDGPSLSREILYTALTRARHGVVIVGDAALIALGAARKLARASGLAARLGAPDATVSLAESATAPSTPQRP